MADDEIDPRAEFLATGPTNWPVIEDAEEPSVHWDASLPLEYEARYRTAVGALGATRLTVNVPIPDPDAHFQIDVTVRKIPAPS